MQRCGDVIMMPAPECQLTSVPGYIVYSACGSFWVPMLGMIVFYWKIYKTADESLQSLLLSKPPLHYLLLLLLHPKANISHGLPVHKL